MFPVNTVTGVVQGPLGTCAVVARISVLFFNSFPEPFWIEERDKEEDLRPDNAAPGKR